MGDVYLGLDRLAERRAWCTQTVNKQFINRLFVNRLAEGRAWV